MKLTNDGKFVITAEMGQISIREIYNLKIWKFFQMQTIVRCISLNIDGTFIFAGMENGKFAIIPFLY